MIYSKIKLNINNDNNEIFKNNLLTTQITKNNKKYELDIDYVFIEKDERIRKSKYKIDNIIGTHGFYQEIVNKKIDEILDSNNFEMSVSFNFELYNLCERLIWTLDLIVNNNNLVNNYSNNLSSNNSLSFKQAQFENNRTNGDNFISQVKLYIDGGLISSVNNLSTRNYSKATDLMNLYKYTTAPTINKGYNCNSFSLEPDINQPTGALNMSMFKIFTIKLILDKKAFTEYISNLKTLYGYNDISFVLKLSTNEYNIIRYQSGLSGLLFIK
jgi:hypothetical protein